MVKQNVFNSWIGKGKPKPVHFQSKSFVGNKYDFFKTHKKDIPVNMFKDNDRDGVANVFDCKPNNPNEQGLIDAVVGAVKGLAGGGIKKGWQEGMAKPGVIKRFRQYREQRMSKMPKTSQEFEDYNNRIQIKEKLRKWREAEKSLKQQQFEKSIAGRTMRAGGNVIQRTLTRIEQANPKYNRVIAHRRSKIKMITNRLATEDLSPKQKARLIAQVQNLRLNQAKSIADERSRSKTQAKKSILKAIEYAYPMAVPYQQRGAGEGEIVSGIPGQRGRPRGTFDPRHAPYGGVIAHRKYEAAQRRAQKQALAMAKAQMKQSQVPQYEQQQYAQQEAQIPQELQGQGITPEYSQAEQVNPEQLQQVQQVPVQQVQMQYPVQQIQQAPQPVQREIKTVFKSSGGSPYPPVDRTPLPPSSQTIPLGFTVQVDSFTGRRFLKPLPKREGWTQ